MVKFQMSYLQAGKLHNPIVQKPTRSNLFRLFFTRKDNSGRAIGTRFERGDWQLN